jgi:hypothetical protein
MSKVILTLGATAPAGRATGPRTEAGKSVSSRNATKHGFSAIHPATLSPGAQELLREVHAGYVRQFRPVTMLEKDLVRRIADESFRQRQIEEAIDLLTIRNLEQEGDLEQGGAAAPEEGFVEALQDREFQRQLALLLRYMASAERAFFRALSTLRQARKDRALEEESTRADAVRPAPGREVEFVSPTVPQPLRAAAAGNGGPPR